MTRGDRLFRSFWSGGFECSSHVNSQGQRLDMIAALGHDVRAASDYALLEATGMLTARDGLRWHRIDEGGEYDWSSWLPMLEAARDQDMQVIWDLFHYGWPDDLDIFSAAFIDRFARFSREAARVHAETSNAVPFFSPVNEISFFTWAATRDLMLPYAYGRDAELKRQLVRAYLASVEAIWSVTPKARILSPEPLIHNVPPAAEPWNVEPSRKQRASQFEAWDMITGRTAREIGGNEKYLDIVGVNFYAANEWEVPGGRKLDWDAGSDDPRWLPLRFLLAEVWQRYERPLYIAETSHYGIGRAAWLQEISAEVRLAIDFGVPLEGVCLYPVLDRFDWEDSSHWHNSGLFDMPEDATGGYRREINSEYFEALLQARALVS